MAKAIAIIEPITDEPEIIESPSTQASGSPSKTPTEDETTQEEDVNDKEDLESIRSRSRSRSRPPYRERIITHHGGRVYSPSPRPHNFVTRLHEIPNLVSTKSLNAFIKLDDVCVDTANNQMVYIANHPFAAADLDKISWIFRVKAQDTWVQKPSITAGKEGYVFDFGRGKEKRGRGRYAYDNNLYEPRYLDDGYDHMGRPSTTMVRLGHALRVFQSDEKKFGTEDVKFVIAVQGKRNAGWFKLVVAHSRQAALVDIFHEILCGHSIQFVGAVGVDVVVPLEVPHKKVKFQRVGSLKEAQACREGVVGVVC